jgi:hypothetical protein
MPERPLSNRQPPVARQITKPASIAATAAQLL